MSANYDPTKPWQVRGLSAGDPVVLHEDMAYSAAKDWFRTYTRNGDWGGWEMIDIFDAAEGEVQDECARSDYDA